MNNITIGQFYNVDSVLHRLDPRVKIVISVVFMLSLFFDKNPVLFTLAILTLGIYIYVSKVPIRFIARGTKSLTMIILLTGAINIFTVKGVPVLVEFGILKITRNGVEAAIYTTLRLVLIIIGSSMMTYTTTPNALTNALENMLGWMKKIGVPVHEFAMVMAIALRFVPVLVEELDKIMKAQKARGVDFNEGNLVKRVEKILPILIPLIVSAMKRSEDLALAMDARCYHGGEGRTKMRPLQYEKRDYLAYAWIIAYVVSMSALAVLF